jgi:autotransporter-associated beta strand protein
MRRDRILQSAVTAALALVPPLAQAGMSSKYQPQATPDEALSLYGTGSSVTPGVTSNVATSATWISPFFHVPENNGSTIVGSWSFAPAWNPAVVPDGGGTATFGNIGDIVGDLVFLDINPTLSGLVLSAQNNVRIFSPPAGIGGTTHTINTPAAGTLELNVPVETLRMSPSQRRFFGSTGREVLDLSFAGSKVVKTGIGSVMLTRPSTNTEFFLKQGTVLLTDAAAVNAGGSAPMQASDDSVFGTGTLHIDGGTLRMVSQAGTPLTFMFNHPVDIGPNGAQIQPGADSPQFNNDITGTGTLHLGYFGDVTYNHAMSYSGDTILDAGVFLHLVGDSASLLNSNIRNWARLDFEGGTEGGNHDRIGDTKTITMAGSGINVLGSGFDFNEKWGTTEVTQGLATVTMYPDIAQGVRLEMDNLTFSNGGLLFVRGVNVGATSGTRSQIFVNNGVTLVGGGGADGTTTKSISPNAYGFTGTTLTAPDSGGAGIAGLMTYTSAGLRPLDLATEYVGTINGSLNAADNVRVTAGEAVGSAKTINALVLGGTGGYAVSGSPLTITSGMLINSGGTAGAPNTISNNLNFGSARGTLVSVGGSTATFDGTMVLSGVISGTNGILVNGGGDVTLSGANTYTGTTEVTGSRLLLTGDVKADGVTPGPLGLSTTAIRLQSTTDMPTDPNSGRYGNPDSSLANGTAGTITIDRDILAIGQQSENNDFSGPSIEGTVTGTPNATVINGGVNISGTKLMVRSNGTTVFNGVISGNGVLRDLEGGTIVLNAANTYSGGTEFEMLGNSDAAVRSVKYLLGNDAAFGTGDLYNTAAGGTPLFIANGGARTIANNFSGFAGFNVGGSNNLTMSGTIDLNASTDTFIIATTGGAVTTFSGNVQRGGLTKGINGATDTGNGTLVLSGNNSLLDGAITIGQTSGSAAFSAGVLQITNSTGLGSGGIINNNTTVVTRSTLELNAVGGNITNLADFVSTNGTGSNNLGAIHNKAGNISVLGANLNLVRFATTPVELINNTSVNVDAGTSLAWNGVGGANKINGSVNDNSGTVTAAVNSQSPATWAPATRTAGTATFNKEGLGTLSIERISNLKISTETVAPTSGFRHQITDRVAFETINVNAGTMVIRAGRDTSTSHIVQDTAPPTTVAGLTAGPYLVNPSTNKTTFVKNLNIAAGATLDLNDNDAIVDYTGAPGPSLASIKSQITTAYNSGAWTGTGITSGSARANSTSPHQTALGYGEITTVVPGAAPYSYSGVDNIDATSVVIRYTWSGDATLEGSVDTVDFNILAANFGGSGKNWTDADFNYDSTVDTVDFNLLASNFGQPALLGDGAGGAAGASAALGSLVPEPTSLALVGLMAGGLLARRRRSN